MENMNILSETLKQINTEDVNSLLLEERKKDEDSKEVEISCRNDTKSREIIEVYLPSKHLISDVSDLELEAFDSDDSIELSFDDIREFDDSLIPKLRNKEKKDQRKTKQIQIQTKIDEQEEAKKKQLIQVVTRGDITKLQSLLRDFYVFQEQGGTEKSYYEIVNETLDDSSNTMLHIAAKKEQADVVNYLLQMGADPCLKNKNMQTPYTCTKSQKVKENLIQFARDLPSKYNYENAKIPVDPDKNKEAEDEKKALRKIMKEKAKEQEKELEILKKEKKKELAAKRRFITQSGNNPVACLFCTNNNIGKVPDEYMKYLFCSRDCLNVFKMNQPVRLW